MVRFLVSFLFCIFLVSCAYAQPERQQDYSFQNFWTEFRRAFLDGDQKTIAALTKFPFEVKGPDDSDPVLFFDKATFLDIYDTLMKQQIYVPSGTGFVTKTMQEIIHEKTTVTDLDLLSEYMARVELFTFVRENGKWLFNRMYIDDTDLIKKSLSKE